MLRWLAPLLSIVACANPSQGLAIERVVPDHEVPQMPRAVTIEGTFSALISNLDQGDTTIASVTATVGAMPLPATWMSQDQISAMMPGLDEGSYDVTVTLDGRTATLKDGYIVGVPTDGGTAQPVTTHRVDINGPVTGGPHTDFPLLVDLVDSRLRTIASGGEVAHDQGFDIFFSLDQAGTMRLSHEIEKYDGAAGDFVAWVKIPTMEAGQVFFIHSGDTTVTTSQENVADVWSNGYGAVWHMGVLVDATANQNDGTDGGTVGVDLDGQIEVARTFDGLTSTTTVTSSATVDDVFDGGGTAEAWIFATSAGQNNFGRLFEKGLLGGWTLSLCDGNGFPNAILFAQVFSAATVNWCTDPQLISLNTWVHVAVTYNDDSAANRPTIFINGSANAVNGPQPAGTRVSDAADPLVIGNRQPGARAFAGSIDEARLSRTIRSNQWIQTAFANQSNPGSFVALGP